MSQFKDAYEAGRRAVNENPTPRMFTAMLTVVGAATISIFAPYVGASTLQTFLSLVAWLFFAAVAGYWRAKRSGQ